MTDLLTLYDHDLRIAHTIPGVHKEVLPTLVRFMRPAPGMNYVAYSHLVGQDLDAIIEEQIAYFSNFEQPFSWHVCDHDLPADLQTRLFKHGFKPDDDPDAVMILDLEKAPQILLEPASRVRLVTSESELDEVIAVEEQVWGGQFGWLKQRLAAHMVIPDYLSIYVAHLNARPVASGWVFFNCDSAFASLYGGSTVAAYRNQGFYTAVLAARVQEARARAYRYLMTGASTMSRPILEHYGFEFLTYHYSLEWQGRQNK